MLCYTDFEEDKYVEVFPSFVRLTSFGQLVSAKNENCTVTVDFTAASRFFLQTPRR
jgi:hypothetical protein